jgi:hypothetical protein
MGNSGLGKTALVANLYFNYKKSNPNHFILSHFVGCSTQSTSHINIIKRVMMEMKKFFKLDLEIPKEKDALLQEFVPWLRNLEEDNKATGQHRGMLIILDGLNQLENIENSHDLHWLPSFFPSCVKVLITCESKHTIADVAHERGKQLA